MKKTILLERYPYRFVETEERGWIEKFSHYSKRYKLMYEVGCEQQMMACLDDLDYVKWLDPECPPCYTKSRIVNHYESESKNSLTGDSSCS